jgi:ribosome-binding factor A
VEHKRADRIADLILKELAEVLLRRVKDPRLADITLTNVEVSPDLRHAKVYYSLLGDDEKRNKATVGLESARGFVNRISHFTLMLPWNTDPKLTGYLLNSRNLTIDRGYRKRA